MSLNIGTPAVKAAETLRGNPDWAAIRASLGELTRSRMNAALEAPPEQRVDATGYARALRDLYVAFESATTGVQIQRVAKPGMEK